MQLPRSTKLAVAVLLLANCGARADSSGTCARCGRCCAVRTVCVPKRVEKEIVKVCWDVRCEDICIPGPSKKCGTQCGEDCCGCWELPVWQPTCAKVITRRVPVKTEVKRKVSAIEWVVECRCEHCCSDH